MTEKKATEMLAEMDAKIDLILKYIQNVDFNLKLQSARSASPVPQPPSTEQNRTEIVASSSSDITFVEVGNEPKSDGRKVTVHQNVYYPNGKPAPLAKIKILDASKQLVKETKTNSTGKWTVVLDPGNYFIHITKAEAADKPKIDHYFEVTVPSTKASFELESKR